MKAGAVASGRVRAPSKRPRPSSAQELGQLMALVRSLGAEHYRWPVQPGTVTTLLLHPTICQAPQPLPAPALASRANAFDN